MILPMAMSEVIFLLLGWVWRSNCLCSPTTFYKNCWIRQFPGLSIDLEPSQKRGAHILKRYSAASAQQCSQTCCLLKNVSCNLAVFYSESNNRSLSCLHAYCPALESCIVKPGASAVLYNITPGMDPDLLVFEKLSFKEPNTRSSFNKWERHSSGRAADSEKCQDASTGSQCLPATAASSAMVQDLGASQSSNHPHLANGSIHHMASTTHLGSTTASRKERFTQVTEVVSRRKGSTSNSDGASLLPTPTLTSVKMLSHMPSPAHLNSSKQHLNETKGYSGRNYTSENEGQRPAWEGVQRGRWLLPIALGSSLILICCCTILLAMGCRRKRRGRYKPRRRGMSAPRQFVRYTMVNNST
ncbi:MANSC domain-containing protein 4 [Eublepharis macularius]|uniref:MANSC domain-containing protein 4 n=1 Tax=Eublepharis macularius TaxID=481883 RepID=A0AA97KIW5_EUBMA|nr:MANSC domain-containing protein 4 [Eublepharis macularius]